MDNSRYLKLSMSSVIPDVNKIETLYFIVISRNYCYFETKRLTAKSDIILFDASTHFLHRAKSCFHEQLLHDGCLLHMHSQMRSSAGHAKLTAAVREIAVSEHKGRPIEESIEPLDKTLP